MRLAMFICDRSVTVAEHAESHRGWILPRTYKCVWKSQGFAFSVAILRLGTSNSAFRCLSQHVELWRDLRHTSKREPVCEPIDWIAAMKFNIKMTRESRIGCTLVLVRTSTSYQIFLGGNFSCSNLTLEIVCPCVLIYSVHASGLESPAAWICLFLNPTLFSDIQTKFGRPL